MMARTTTQTVTFARSFVLTGAEGRQPAGTYNIEIDEEVIDGLTCIAYRRIGARIRLAADPQRPGYVETANVDPAELEALLAYGLKAEDSAPDADRRFAFPGAKPAKTS